MKQRPFFPLFFRNRLKLQYLTIEQRGELFTALYDYAEDGMYPNFDGVLGMAFEVFRDDIDSSLEHYRKRSEQNKLNGQKGAEARWGNKNGERHNQDGENSQSEAEVEKEVKMMISQMQIQKMPYLLLMKLYITIFCLYFIETRQKSF